MINRRNGDRNAPKRNGSNAQPSIVLAPRDELDEVQQGELIEGSSNQLVRTEAFDQPVILQQPNVWSRAILWGIVGFASTAVIWASIAKIEEAIPATGQLEPQGRVQEIQAPVNGVVQEIYVEDGQSVKKGDLLMRFDPTTAEAERKSLEQIRASLERQNQFYRSQLNGSAVPSTAQAQQLDLPPEVIALTSSRATLLEEISLYEAQLNGSTDTAGLTAEQAARIQSGISEARSREASAELEVSQLQEQLNQARTQLATARQTLAIDENVLGDLQTLLAEGGVQRLQVTRQQQQVLESRSEVERLVQEEQRLTYAINQANQKSTNEQSTTQNTLLEKIAANRKEIASIESQLNQKILDNQDRLSEITSQISQNQQTLKYQELRAPVDGIVFDLKAKGTGFVANTSEPILKVVPSDGLRAEVFVTNKDIGFIEQGMPVDIRIDTFPFSEFGDIKGKIINIGSDALPPDEVHQYYRFPVTVEMDGQTIRAGGRDIPLQAGMSVTANVITRDRTIMSIFTDQFTRQVDNIRTVR